MKTTATKTLITLAALAASLTAMTAPSMASAAPRPPVHAQAHLDMRASAQLDARISGLKSDIARGKQTRQLSRAEATRLSAKVNALAAQKRTYERSGRGLTGSEIATLNAKLDTLSARVRVQAHDNNRR